MRYKYVKYVEAPMDTYSSCQKPTNVSLADYSKALEESRYDLKRIARYEVDRANRKVETAANQNAYESMKMRQTYNILDQGPSNGPGFQRR